MARELHRLTHACARRGCVALNARGTNDNRPDGPRPGIYENNREHSQMSQQSEPGTDAKSRSWMFLVAAFVVLVLIGILNS